jgi:MFS family permease
MDNSGAILGPALAFVLLSAFQSDYKIVFLIATIPAMLGVLSVAIFVREAQAPSGAKPAQPKDTSRKQKPGFSALPARFRLFVVIVFVFTLGNSADAFLLVKTTETGIAVAFVPFVYMIFSIVSVIAAIPVGKLSDKIGREKLITAGFLLYAICYFFFGHMSDIRIFLLLFAGYGLYLALVDVSQKALISDIVGKELKGTAYGIYHAVLGIGLLPANLIAGLLYDNISPGAPFYFGSAMAVIAAILMFASIICYRK